MFALVVGGWWVEEMSLHQKIALEFYTSKTKSKTTSPKNDGHKNYQKLTSTPQSQ